MALLYACLIVILRSQQNASLLLNTKIKRISQFSVKISSLNLIGHAMYQELEKLFTHIDNVSICFKFKLCGLELDEDKEKWETEKIDKKKTKTTWQKDLEEGKKVDENRIRMEVEEEERRKKEIEDEENFAGHNQSEDDIDDKMKDLTKAAAKKDGVIFDFSFPLLSHIQIDKFDEKLEVLNERAEVLKWQHHYNKLDNMEIMNDYEMKASEVKAKLANVLSQVKENQPENVIGENITDIIIVFKTIDSAQGFAKIFTSKNCWTRMLYWIFCQKRKLKKYYFNDEWLNVEYSPDEPNDIKWDGLSYPACKKCCINFWLIIAGILLSFLSILIIKIK